MDFCSRLMQLNLMNLAGVIICWEMPNWSYPVWPHAKFCCDHAGVQGMLLVGCTVIIIAGYMHCDSDRQLHHGCHHNSDPCSPAPNNRLWCKVSSIIGDGKPVTMGLPLGFFARAWSTFNQAGRDSQGVTPGQGSNPVGHRASPVSLWGFRQALLATSQARSCQIFCLPKTRQVWLTQRPEWVEPWPTATRQARLTKNA